MGLGTVQEGTFVNGARQPGRWLNGDDVVISYGTARGPQHATITGLKFPGTNATIQKASVYVFGR